MPWESLNIWRAHLKVELFHRSIAYIYDPFILASYTLHLFFIKPTFLRNVINMYLWKNF